MTGPGKGGVLTALALPVALSGCAGEPTSSSSAADPSASSPSNPPLDSDGAVLVPRPTAPPGPLPIPTTPMGRDLTITYFFMVDDDMTEDLHDVATLGGRQKAIGGGLSYGEAVLELGLAICAGASLSARVRRMTPAPRTTCSGSRSTRTGRATDSSTSLSTR